MRLLFAVLSSFLLALPALAQDACFSAQGLAELDGSWERALKDSDVEALSTLLADDFVWVHNHASAIDNKQALIDRAADPKRGASGHPISRTRSDVEVRILGQTGVVSGFTVVNRGDAKPRYHFMRTYVAFDGACLLLANHTMQLPEDS